MSLREAAKLRRRQRILQAARELIHEGGLEGLSMRRLARLAELSTRTLYNLYGAKEDILFALMEESVEELGRTFEAFPPADPLERSRALLTVSMDRLSEDEMLYRCVLREGVPLASRVRETVLMARVRKLHEDALRDAMREGLLDASFSPRVLAHQVLMGYGQALRLWSREVFDQRALRAQALHAWALYLLAAATDASRPRLRRWVLQLRPEVEQVIERLDRLATEDADVSASLELARAGAAASEGSG